jgi:hypothetical protein
VGSSCNLRFIPKQANPKIRSSNQRHQRKSAVRAFAVAVRL